MKRDIGRKQRFFHTPPPFDALARGGGSRRNVAIAFGLEKLEWCGYSAVKKFEDTITHFEIKHERDRHTDGQTGILREHRPRLCIALRAKNEMMSVGVC